MNQEEFTKLLEATLTSCESILMSKGREYAGSTDRLANFKRGASLTGATVLQVAFIYASKHYDSIASYVRDQGRAPLSEPISGRLDDLINYCILMKAIIVEREASEPKPIEVNETPKPRTWSRAAPAFGAPISDYDPRL